MSVYPVVLLALLIGAAVAAGGLLVAMYAKDKPFYGVIALGLLTGPGSLLALAYLGAG
ncbi:hypothetical protein B0I31_12450 [Saccharothrix carnea]|uniref:Uncharacterized protein n=1 Tax=Saccharothrix carnea TaxID=1280637 RepID=A0A2P8HR07_SACCR|nr:hypothetical protein [Saccharothrix carnea]PSL48663.1 hypothetical protein B0I31_12450 [Saccharothrix carnea]